MVGRQAAGSDGEIRCCRAASPDSFKKRHDAQTNRVGNNNALIRIICGPYRESFPL
jgi:hypothetical protein